MVTIRIAKPEEIRHLVPIYKASYTEHNVFMKSDEEVRNYIENLHGTFIIAEEDSRIVGGLCIQKSITASNHILAKFVHFAVDKEHRRKGIGTAIFRAAEKAIGKGKIELFVSEKSQEFLEFYKSLGYEIEGKLKNHFRPNEFCYILGRTLE